MILRSGARESNAPPILFFILRQHGNSHFRAGAFIFAPGERLQPRCKHAWGEGGKLRTVAEELE